MRKLSEKEQGELDFWIEHILGMGCIRESGRDYTEQWSSGSIGRIERFRSDVSAIRQKSSGVWVDVGTGPYPTLLHAPPGAMSIMIDPLMKHYFHHGLVPTDRMTEKQVFLDGAIENLPLRDECADVVLCLNALDHVDEPWVGLEELTRILKVGGYLVIEVDVGGVTDYMHPHAFGSDELEAQAKRLGLVAQQSGPIDGGKRRPGAQLYQGYWQRKTRVEGVFPKAAPPNPDKFAPLLVKEGVMDFNVVRFRDGAGGDRYYGIQQSEGAFHYEKIKARKYEVFYEGATLDDVVAQIEKR